MTGFTDLVAHAIGAREHAHAVYSGFKVGAAVVTTEGAVYTGCNIETSSYSLTICAERVAIFNAIASAEKSFSAIAIAAQEGEFCPPCGACRQVLWDLAGDIRVILVASRDKTKEFRLSELLPHAFDKGFLKDEY